MVMGRTIYGNGTCHRDTGRYHRDSAHMCSHTKGFSSIIKRFKPLCLIKFSINPLWTKLH